MKKLFIIGSVGLCLMACQPQTQQETSAIPVRVLTIDSTESVNTHTYVGHVEASQSTLLSFSLGGRVTAVYCQTGQAVTQGQALIKVDDTQQINALEAAKAALQQAQDGYERVQKVYSKGGVPEVKVVEIETKLKQAQSLVDAAQQELENATLRAANDGVVSAACARNGQVLLPAQPAVEVVDNRQLVVVIPVPEKQISRIQIKDKGVVFIPAIDLTCEGVVVEKELTSSSPAHTYDVKLNVLSQGSQLLPDMVAKVQLMGDRQCGIVLPAECVQTHKDGKSVWVVVEGLAERRRIETGMFTSQGVIVTAGLNRGDIVVVDGYQKLSRGAKVQIQDK